MSQDGTATTPRLRVARTASGVVTLHLDNPARRNALDFEMAAQLRQAVQAASDDARARCVVITGTGSSFCSGADLRELMARGGDDVLVRRERLGAYYRTFLDVRDLAAPTLAAVNGPAIGAGLNLALACDMRLAAPSARFGATFARLGTTPGGGATHLLTRLIGPALAAEMVLGGELVDAQRAAQIGLVNRVVASEEALLDEAMELAERIAANAPAAVRASKRALHLALDAPFEAVLEIEALAQAASQSGADAQEGWRAFRQKRPPRFTGE
jgi:enoyl-CoA hydratase/carnithine racemase